MIKILLILLIVATVIAIGYYYRLKTRDKTKSGVHKKMEERKGMTKDRILKLFENKDRITNQEVQSILLIEESETKRYLDQLEKETKIRKMGHEEDGNVYYVKIKEEKTK